MSKFGFLILVLVFGACIFVAGVLAPAEVREPVREYARLFYDQYGKPLVEDAESLEKQVAAAGSAAAIDYKTLVRPAKDGQLGIPAGLYSTEEEAGLEQQELQQLNIASRMVTVKVADHLTWVLLAAGPYASETQAQVDIARLRERYGYSRSYELISWPDT